MRAGLASTTAVGAGHGDALVDLLRRRYEVTLRRAERQRLQALRDDGTIGDAAFQRIETELDLEELDLQQLAPGDDSAGG